MGRARSELHSDGTAGEAMSCKLIYKDIAVGADTDASISAIGADTISNVSLLARGVIHPDFATLELNRWGGGGDKKIYNGQPVALVSTAMSGADCAFASPPSVTVLFDNNYTTLGIFLRFATLTEDYATSVTLTWYRGTTQLDRKTFTPDGAEYFCRNTVTAYNKLVISINATNLPYRFARLEQIIFGVVREFGAGELGGVDILQEVNLISSEISINTLDWRLKSTSGVDYLFQMKQPVLAYNNSKLIGVFYIDDKAKRTAENTYAIPCCDAIGVLDCYDFDAVMYRDKNAVTALREIVGGVFELDIDGSFSDVTLTGLNPKGTRRTALQQVAFAIGAVVDTSGSEKIRIYPPAASAPETIPPSRLYDAGTVEQDAVVTAVAVTYHTYTEGGGVTGDDVVTVGGVKYVHTTGTVRVDNPNVTAADKQNVKAVREATLVNASNAAAVAARVYAYHQRRNTVSSRIVVAGEAPGAAVSVPTKWGSTMAGNITSMKIKLSNTTAANITIKAVES